MEVRDGACYILKETHADAEYLLRFSEEEPEDMSYVDMYLFGEKNMLGTQHDYNTPKDLLVECLFKNIENNDCTILAREEDMPVFEYLDEKDGYKATVDDVVLIAESRVELAVKVLPHLRSETIIKLIRLYTDYDIVSIFCEGGDPEELKAVYEDDDLQIGYAVVNTAEMHENTFYASAKMAVEQFLEDLYNPEDIYCYSIFIKDDDGSWTKIEEGEPFSDTDMNTNGLYEIIGYEWMYAKKATETTAQ